MLRHRKSTRTHTHTRMDNACAYALVQYSLHWDKTKHSGEDEATANTTPNEPSLYRHTRYASWFKIKTTTTRSGEKSRTPSAVLTFSNNKFLLEMCVVVVVVVAVRFLLSLLVVSVQYFKHCRCLCAWSPALAPTTTTSTASAVATPMAFPLITIVRVSVSLLLSLSLYATMANSLYGCALVSFVCVRESNG